MKIKSIIAGLAIAATAAFAGSASAKDWAPKGPLMFYIGFGAGGSTDTMGRVIAKVMKEQTGWNVVVENKPGGGGVAMFTKVAKSKPNGQVVGMGVSTPILMQLVLRPEKMAIGIDDFDYIATVARGELAVVARSDAPFNDLESMVKYAKANGPLKMALNAKPGKFVLNAVARETGIKFQYVSTKGGAESMKLLMGKQVMAATAGGAHAPLLKSGDVKMIAVANDSRHSYAPNVKTIAEQGYGLSVDPYFFIATTKGTDPAILSTLTKAIRTALATDTVKTIVRNSAKSSLLNLGPAATKKKMVDGLPVMRKLVKP